LLASGDPELRHHTGYSGELLLPTALGVALAVLAFMTDRSFWNLRWNRVLVGGFLLSPIAAALTNDVHHSLRCFSLFVFAAPLSIAGIEYIARRSYNRRILPVLVLGMVLHSGLFVRNYFGEYADKTIGAFDTYGLEHAVRKALKFTTGKIVLDDQPYQSAGINSLYVGSVMRYGYPKRSLPPLQPGQKRDVGPGDAFIFLDPDGRYPKLHEGLPARTRYVVQSYDQLGMKPTKRR
jgi:hypothetical protein